MLSTQCQLNKIYTQQLYIFLNVLLPDKIYDWKIYTYIHTTKAYTSIGVCMCLLKSQLNIYMQQTAAISYIQI